MSSFLHKAVETLIHYLMAFGGWGVAIGMALENAGAPLPSEVILPFAGYLVWQGELTMTEALLIAVASGMVGSTGAYLVGWYGGRPLLNKYGRYVFINEHHLSAAEAWFQQHGERAVFTARLLPVIRGVISYPAGLTRMHFGRFFGYSLMGTIIFSWAFIYAGFLLGENWDYLQVWTHKLNYILLLLIAIAIVYYRYQSNKKLTRK